MAILSALVILLGQILTHTSQAWIQNKASIERQQNARISTDFIGKELQAALLPTDRTSTNSLQFVVNPAALSADRGHRDSIFFQIPSNIETSLGDVAEVGYFVKWDASNPENPRPNLHRFFLPAGDPNFGLGAGASSLFLYSRPDSWITDATASSISPANKASGYRGLFAENVLGLWVQCLDAKGLPIAKDYHGSSLATAQSLRFDSRIGYTDSQNAASPGYMPPNGGAARPLAALPIAVDIGFVMLDESGARKITPAVQSTVVSLVQSSTTAKSFVEAALANATLKPIRSGLRYYQTRIFLENSK
jgi:hypothetical protein